MPHLSLTTRATQPFHDWRVVSYAPPMQSTPGHVVYVFSKSPQAHAQGVVLKSIHVMTNDPAVGVS